MPENHIHSQELEPRKRGLRAGDGDREASVRGLGDREAIVRGLRAGDGDREAIATVLRDQHLAGRLETDEFQERLDRCYSAKTYGELDELVADLPREERMRPVGHRRVRTTVVLPALVIAVVAVSVLSGGHLVWLAIPLFFGVGRPLLWGSRGRRYRSGPRISTGALDR